MTSFIQRLTVLGAGAVLLLTVQSALAADSCETIICLQGSILGGKSIQDCRQPIQNYFDIRKTKKKGRFDSGSTYQARYNYLNECKDADAASKASIQGRYGHVDGMPGGL